MKQTCPACGHDVKVVGDTTQHYEPIGCFQITDDHQLCDQQVQQLRETLFGLEELIGASSLGTPGAKALRERTLREVVDRIMAEVERRSERQTCCFTYCDKEQGTGTWMQINGETLPVCEEHWYGNLDAERRQLRADIAALEARVQKLRDALFNVTWTVINESESHTFGKPGYDITLDHLHDTAVVAREVLYDD